MSHNPVGCGSRVISSSRDLGAFGPVSERGGGKGFPYWVRFSPLFPLLFHSGGARGFFWLHGSGATSRQLDLLDHEATCIAAPRTGHLSHGSEKVTLGFLEVPFRFWGIPRLVGLPPLCFWGVSGGLILGRAPPFPG